MGTRALTLPPRAGWNWLGKGWALFRKNPAAVMVMTGSYVATMVFLSILIPVLGSVLVAVLTPGLSAGLMTGCRLIDRGLPVTPGIILSAFLEDNRRLARRFFELGLFYVGCVAVVGILSLPFGSVDMSAIMQPDGQTPERALGIINQLAIMTVLYTPVMMLFWYAPALVLWHEIEPRKALFFSLVTVWRNRGAFLIYGMGWLLWMSGAVSVFIALASLLPLPGLLLGALNFIVLMGIVGISICTFYPSYIDVFEAAPASDA